jgi:peptidoglycan hydrolase-like protein with peptidoglycan-binding domain
VRCCFVGACVSSTQELLNGKGASLTVDGDFGPATLQAVKNFQSSKGLSVSKQPRKFLTHNLPSLS